MRLCKSRVLLLSVISCLLSSFAHSSVLERVLQQIDAIYPSESVFDLTANIAENGGGRGALSSLLGARIDGSVTNIITSARPFDVMEQRALDARLAVSLVDIRSVTATAIGAVNTGEIITTVRGASDLADLGLSDIAKTRLSQGPSSHYYYASAHAVAAVANRTTQIGSGIETATMALNMASNSAAITGRVHNTLSGVSGTIENILTTTIGALNNGQISP